MLGLILNSAGPYPHREEILAILLDMSFWNVIKTKLPLLLENKITKSIDFDCFLAQIGPL